MDGLPVQSGCFSGFMAEIGGFSRIGMKGQGSEKRDPQLRYRGSSGHIVEDSAGSQSRVQQDCYGAFSRVRVEDSMGSQDQQVRQRRFSMLRVEGSVG